MNDFLKEEGIFEEAQAQAVKEVVAWQLDEAMRKKKISKNKMATLLKTSRTQVDRPESEERHHAVQPAARGGDGGTAGDDRAGVIKRDPKIRVPRNPGSLPSLPDLELDLCHVLSLTAILRNHVLNLFEVLEILWIV